MSDNGPSSPKYPDLTGRVTLIDDEPFYEGSYSKVFKGRLSPGGEIVAVKVLKPIPGKDETSLKRKSTRELTAWAKSSYVLIAEFLGHATGSKYGPLGAIISKWYENGDARSYLERRKATITLWDRLKLFQYVCLGVTFLHNRGIVHGDIKLQNILIDDDGTPRICDFGLATLYLTEPGSGMTTTSEYTGTPRYIAPELLGLEPTLPTEASDIWAMGCVGLEILLQLQPHARRINNARGIIYQDIKAGKLPAEKAKKVGLEDAIQEFLHLFWHPDPDKRIPLWHVWSLIQLMVGETEIKINDRTRTVDIRKPCLLFELVVVQRAREEERKPCFFFRTPTPARLQLSKPPLGIWKSEPWQLFRVYPEDATGDIWKVYEVHTETQGTINAGRAVICTLDMVLGEYQALRRRGKYPFPIDPAALWASDNLVLGPLVRWTCQPWV